MSNVCYRKFFSLYFTDRNNEKFGKKLPFLSIFSSPELIFHYYSKGIFFVNPPDSKFYAHDPEQLIFDSLNEIGLKT